MATKTAIQRQHAKKRASERYGLSLNRDSLEAIVASIQLGEAKFLKRKSNRITIWKVDHAGERMFAVYDSKRSNVVSFLDPKCKEIRTLLDSENKEEFA